MIVSDILESINFSEGKECTSIPLQAAPEDIKILGNFAYSGIDLRLSLYENADLGPSKTPNGGMIGIDMTSLSYFNMSLVGYPPEKQFHPLGFDIYKEKLFHIVNLDYASGADKIEVFELQGKSLMYIKTIHFEDHYMGQINSVIFVCLLYTSPSPRDS